MKISILLPYKENFSPTYAGAVSLFVKDTVKLSEFKKNKMVLIYYKDYEGQSLLVYKKNLQT